MTQRRTPFCNIRGDFGMIALAALLLLALPNLHAQVFGVLNPPSAPQTDYTDNNQDGGHGLTYTAEGWIAFAEQSAGDGTACAAPAVTYVGYAETAWDQWITSDAGYGVAAVSIPVEWALYQPNLNGSPTYDACYKQFLSDMITKYVKANYQIDLTISTNHGPSWLTGSGCPNCQFVGQDSVSPPVNGGAGGPSGTVVSYYIANIVFDEQVRNLAGPFIDDAFASANVAVSSASGGARAQVDLVRIGISENGETRYPLAFNCKAPYDLEWWAFDNAAQSPAITNGIRYRPQQIGDPGNPANNDCLFGWYPGKGAPSNSRPSECTLDPGVTTEQATLDWWSWYFNALADAHAFLYHRFRKDGFAGPIAFVTPGAGTDPDDLFTYLQDYWSGNLTGPGSYEENDPNETVNAGAAWFILYDQIIYSLQNVWNLPNIGDMRVDHSSVAANSNPPTEDDQTMNPYSICGHAGPDLQLSITPMPSSSAPFQMPMSGYQTGSSPDPFPKWSTIRKMRFYAYIQGDLPLMGENPGNNPYTGQWSSTTGYVTGMNDVFTLYNACGLKELLWAFDGELNASGGNVPKLSSPITSLKVSTPITNGIDVLTQPYECTLTGNQSYSGADANIEEYGSCINSSGYVCPN